MYFNMVISVVGESYTGLIRKSVLTDADNTIAQRLVHQSSVKHSHLCRSHRKVRLSGSIPGVIGYTILKYIVLSFYSKLGIATVRLIVL